MRKPLDFYLYQQMVIYDLLKRCLLRLESEASWKRVLMIGLSMSIIWERWKTMYCIRVPRLYYRVRERGRRAQCSIKNTSSTTTTTWHDVIKWNIYRANWTSNSSVIWRGKQSWRGLNSYLKWKYLCFIMRVSVLSPRCQPSSEQASSGVGAG